MVPSPTVPPQSSGGGAWRAERKYVPIMIRCVTALILGAAVKSSGLYSRRGEEEEEEDEEEEEELEDEDEDEEEEEEEEEEERRRVAEGSWGFQPLLRARVLRALLRFRERNKFFAIQGEWRRRRLEEGKRKG